MTEQMVYIFVGVVMYLWAYAVIGCSATLIWKNWAWRKAGQFWDYSLNEGLKQYYPGVWYFVKRRHFLYSAMYIILWPVMVPGQMAMNTKVLRRVMSREYWR